MVPVGNYIKISTPEMINNTPLLSEKEPISKATALSITSDEKISYKEDDTVYFYTGQEIRLSGEIFVNNDHVVGYKKSDDTD